MLDFEEIKDIVLKETEKLYNLYSKKGLLSIYWYGSGLRNEDFNQNSDVDLVAISEERFSFEYEQEMINILKKIPNSDIRIRILYLGELNGKETKSFLASVLPIKLWLINFEDYLYLNGKKFNSNDFLIKKASFKEAIKIQKKMYVERRDNFIEDNSKGMYLIKSVLHYIYYFNCIKFGYYSFSYYNLINNSFFYYLELVKDLLEIKKLNYPSEKVLLLLPKLDEIMLS